MTLPITLAFAAAAALIDVWLGARVSLLRVRHRLSFGDGGDPILLVRMRAHANFVEYTPFALILCGLIEFARGPSTWLWAASALFLVARLIHPLGMDRPSPSPLRIGGIAVTLAVLLWLAVWALVIVWHPAGTATGFELAPTRT